MRKTALLLLLGLLGLVVATQPALAWGTATHAYVAKALASDFVSGPTWLRPYLECQFAYGAMAPDLAWVAPASLQASLGQATHQAPGYDDVFDLGQPSQPATIAFALGWLTHNEVWGADFWAHNPADGYVVTKAAILAGATGVPDGLAHDTIEIAVDLLLDHQHDPGIGGYVSQAAALRDLRIPALLAKSYPGFDAAALTNAERTFKASTVAYGALLALRSPSDDNAAVLGLAVRAKSSYGLSLSLAQSKALLTAATNLVRYDYWPALQNTIEQTGLGLQAWLAAH